MRGLMPIAVVLTLGIVPQCLNRGSQGVGQPQAISQTVAPVVPGGAETWSVVRVSDGDTITAQRGGQEERIRFACIDAV